MQKSWTACGYPQENDLRCNNEKSVVVWTDKEIGTMVEQLCGPEVRTNFDDVECGPDEHFPSGDECSSDEDTSSDDSVEEIYVEASVTTNVIAAAKVNANDDCHVCAAGALRYEGNPP